MKKLTTAINYLLVQPDELPPAEQALVQIIHMHDTATFT